MEIVFVIFIFLIWLLSFLPVILTALFIIYIVFKFFISSNSKDNRAFINSDRFQHFAKQYKIENKPNRNIRVHFSRRKKQPSDREVYRYFIEYIREYISAEYPDISEDIISNKITFEDFKNLAYSGVDEMVHAVQSDIDKQKELSLMWFYEIVDNDDSLKSYIVAHVKKELIQMKEYISDEVAFVTWFYSQYRHFEIYEKLKEFKQLNTDLDLETMMWSLENTEEYSQYVNGFSDIFEPSNDRKKNSDSYLPIDGFRETDYSSRHNPWFWLWLYANNHYI